jgi:RNA polymerase sigma-70 factor (ECF subfamily)
MNENDLNIDELNRLKSGPDEIASVFSSYQDRLMRLVRFRMDPRLLSRVECDDILQEAYMEVQRRIDDFINAPTVPFFIWIRQITMQTLIDIQRKHLGAQMRDVKREIKLGQKNVGFTNSFSIAAHLIGNLTSPSQAAVRQERINQVREALESMEEIDREVLVLRHLEELNNNEVANVLGLEKSAASKRYIRALKKLRSVIDEAN